LGSGTLNFGGSSLESYLENRSYSGWAEYYNVKEEDETTTFHIAVGSVVNPKIHLGLDISGVSQEASCPRYDPSYYLSPAKVEMQLRNYFAAVSYFPFEKGLFLKAGGGTSELTQTTTVFFEQKDKFSGFGYMIGIGYDLRIVKRLHIGIHADYSEQTYHSSDAPDDTDFSNIYLALYFY